MSTFQQDLIDVIRMSDLTRREIAIIFGVSRQSIYKWLDGRDPHRTQVAAVAAKALPALRSALARKILPFPKLDREVRVKRVRDMAAVIAKLATPNA